MLVGAALSSVAVYFLSHEHYLVSPTGIGAIAPPILLFLWTCWYFQLHREDAAFLDYKTVADLRRDPKLFVCCLLIGACVGWLLGVALFVSPGDTLVPAWDGTQVGAPADSAVPPASTPVSFASPDADVLADAIPRQAPAAVGRLTSSHRRRFFDDDEDNGSDGLAWDSMPLPNQDIATGQDAASSTSTANWILLCVQPLMFVAGAVRSSVQRVFALAVHAKRSRRSATFFCGRCCS